MSIIHPHFEHWIVLILMETFSVNKTIGHGRYYWPYRIIIHHCRRSSVNIIGINYLYWYQSIKERTSSGNPFCWQVSEHPEDSWRWRRLTNFPAEVKNFKRQVKYTAHLMVGTRQLCKLSSKIISVVSSLSTMVHMITLSFSGASWTWWPHLGRMEYIEGDCGKRWVG